MPASSRWGCCSPKPNTSWPENDLLRLEPALDPAAEGVDHRLGPRIAGRHVAVGDVAVDLVGPDLGALGIAKIEPPAGHLQHVGGMARGEQRGDVLRPAHRGRGAAELRRIDDGAET